MVRLACNWIWRFMFYNWAEQRRADLDTLGNLVKPHAGVFMIFLLLFVPSCLLWFPYPAWHLTTTPGDNPSPWCLHKTSSSLFPSPVPISVLIIASGHITMMRFVTVCPVWLCWAECSCSDPLWWWRSPVCSLCSPSIYWWQERGGGGWDVWII